MAAGTAYKDDESKSMKDRIHAYFQKISPKAKKEIFKRTKAPPMQANVLVARGVDRTLSLGLNHGIAKYSNDGLPRLFLPLGASRQTRELRSMASTASCSQSQKSCVTYDDGRCVDDLCGQPIVELHCCADCGSVGFAHGLWQFTKGGAQGTFTSDTWAHDCHNSVRRALVESKLWGLILEWTLVGNWSRAPFHSDAFLSNFQEAGRDMLTFLMDHNDNFFWPMFYEQIAQSQGSWGTGDEWTEPHMQMVLAALQGAVPLYSQGDNIKLSRWFSLWDQWDERLAKWASFYLMVLTWIGMEKEWLDDDLMSFIAGDRAPVSATVAEVRPEGASAPSRSVKQSGDMMRALRSRCRSTEHTVALILSNKLGKKLMTGLFGFIKKTRLVHGRAMVLAKTPKGCKELRVRSATGGWQDELWELVSTVGNPQELGGMGFLSPAEFAKADEVDKEIDETMASTLLHFVLSLLGARIDYTCAVEYALPGAAAALLAPQPAATLQKFQEWWQALLQLEQDCKESVEAQRFALNLVFPHWSWTTTLMLDLWEHQFQGLSLERREALEKWCRGWATTKVDEDAIGYLKLKASQSERKTLSRMSRWAHLAQSDLLEGYGRHPVTIANDDMINASGVPLTAEVFKADLDDNTMPLQHFASMEEPAGLPKMTPEKFHTIGLRFAAYVKAQNYENLAAAWWCLLLQQHKLLCELLPDGNRHKVVGLVLLTTEHYALIWKVKLLSREHKLFSIIPLEKPYWDVFLLMQPLTKFFLMEIQAVSPRRVKQLGCAKCELAFTVKGGKQEILHCAAKAGFKGLTVPWLERLYEELKVPIRPRPSKEAELVKGLIQHIFPEASDEEVMGWVKQRGKVEEVLPSVLTEEVLEVVQQQAAIDEGDHEEFVKQVNVEKRWSQKASASEPSSSVGVAISVDPVPSDEHHSQRVLLPNPVDWDVDNPSVEVARTWLPMVAGCKIHKDERYFHRWSIAYPGGPQKIYTKAWNTTTSPLETLRQLLDKVWQVHFNLTGEECPFNLRTLGS